MTNINKKLITSASDDTIFKLKTLAKEKEIVRRKLAVTAGRLALKTKQLAVTAKEKEHVRRKLVVTAKKLKKLYEALEKKVFERTKDLAYAKARNEAMIASMGDGLVAVDKEGAILIVNNAFENLVGWKEKDVLGKLLVEVVQREDEAGNIVPFKERILTKILSADTTTAAAADTAAAAAADWYYIRKDKTRFPVASIITPFILEGKIIGAVEVFRDITKEKAVDKAKTEFVSLASHQLRTPLSTVNWYAEMLLAGDMGKLNEGQKKYLDEVYHSNQRMVTLVNALLDVSRIELGTFVVEPEPTNVVELARSVMNEQKPQIDKKKIMLFPVFEKNIPSIQADPKLLRMVMQNLLSNAVKYTSEGGKVDISLSLDKGRENIKIQISDTGYGIPKNQQDKIFTKLFRADNVRDKDTGGTGLGLYIVKSVVENFGGKIWFESQENKGTTFFVTLPSVRIEKRGDIKASG